jgi:putative membrane protein
MFNSKRLHPIAIIVNIFKTIKDLIFPIVFFTFLPGQDNGFPEYIRWLVLSVFSLIVIAIAIVGWLRFTYRVEDGELKIESGVFVRKNRYIRFERIHSIDVSQGIIQQLFGLVKISIETAGGSQAEAVLSAIRKEEAERLNQYFLEAKRSKHVTEEVNEEQIEETIPSFVYKQTFSELFLMSATSGAVGVVLSGIVAFLSQFDEFIPFERLFGQSKAVLELGTFLLIGFAVIGIILVYIAAIISMMLKYTHFTVEKKEAELIISRGLLEKRQLTIPLKKIQGIRIVENLVRQPLGYATVYLEYAGGSVAEKESLTVMLFPFVKKKNVQEKLEQLIPDYVADLPLNSLPVRAYPRYVFRQWIIFAPIIIVCIYFWRPWGYSSLFLLLIGLGWAYLQYKATGWNITGTQLTLRSRFISKQTLLMHKNKIQSIESRTSRPQKQKRLTTISALIKSGIALREGKIRDVEAKDFITVQTWFLPNKRS